MLCSAVDTVVRFFGSVCVAVFDAMTDQSSFKTQMLMISLRLCNEPPSEGLGGGVIV